MILIIYKKKTLNMLITCDELNKKLCKQMDFNGVK